VMSFRDQSEAVELANNTRYGLAASVWSENINLALHVAPQLKAGVVWINGTNMFDAACGFGGFRESGFGREGGREGMREYLQPLPDTGKRIKLKRSSLPIPSAAYSASDLIDRTPKLFIGGNQVRPDGGYSFPVVGPKGKLIGEAGLGSRKDIRDAVSAARAASAWRNPTGYNRAQILYFLAENLAARSKEFADRLRTLVGSTGAAAKSEVDAAIERIFAAA